MMTGWTMLFYKEVLRFWKVSFQTVGAPVLTAVMYLMIFGHVLEEHVQVYDGVSYTAFLIPGLVMMSVLQNAFANSSSSMVQSKIMGNLVFLLLTPLSHWSWFFAYALSAMVTGVAGLLSSFNAGFVSPESLHWSVSGIALVMVVVGGFKSVIGPIVGAIVYFLFKDLLGDYATYWMAIFGATLIAVIVFSPDGIAGALARLFKPRATHGAATGPRGH